MSIAALDRAAELVNDPARRSELLLRSSEHALEQGCAPLARARLARAQVGGLEPRARARALIVGEGVHPSVDGTGATIATFVDTARSAHADGDHDLALSVLWAAASRCWWTSASMPERLAVVATVDGLTWPGPDPRLLAILSYTAPHERHPGLRQQLLDAEPSGDELAALRFRASTAYNLGDHALAARLFTGAVARARHEGRLGLVTRLQALQGWSMLWSADLESVAMLAADTERLAGELSQPMWRGAAVLELALVAGLRGEYLAAKQCIEQAFTSPDIREIRLYHAMCLYGLSVAALGAGRYEDAYRYLRRITDPADEVSHYGSEQWVLADLAEAAVGAGRVAECAEQLAALDARLRADPTPAVRYSALCAQALLADHEEAQARFEVALAADPGGGHLARARLQLGYGHWLRRHRRTRDARDMLREARWTFDRIGAGGFSYQATRELRAAGDNDVGPARPELTRLTPQERQVAQLAAQGLSNRQIGEQLFMSHRTVGSHLYHLFPKLGVTNRTQLTGVLRATQLDTSPGGSGRK